MNVKENLLRRLTKKEVHKLAEEITANPTNFNELIQLYLAGPYRITQRAAGIINSCTELNTSLVIPHLKAMLEKLKEPGVHDAAKRNTIRILQFCDIPEDLEGDVMDICFSYLASGTEAVAIKVFSMTVLGRMTRKYPELKNELQILIEDQLPYEKPAFVSRGKKVLKDLKKI